jgi:hypothetical protein
MLDGNTQDSFEGEPLLTHRNSVALFSKTRTGGRISHEHFSYRVGAGTSIVEESLEGFSSNSDQGQTQKLLKFSHSLQLFARMIISLALGERNADNVAGGYMRNIAC